MAVCVSGSRGKGRSSSLSCPASRIRQGVRGWAALHLLGINCGRFPAGLGLQRHQDLTLQQEDGTRQCTALSPPTRSPLPEGLMGAEHSQAWDQRVPGSHPDSAPWVLQPWTLWR